MIVESLEFILKDKFGNMQSFPRVEKKIVDKRHGVEYCFSACLWDGSSVSVPPAGGWVQSE
jgi:hypothetical protein